MIGKVYMMLCERARPAGIEVALARSSRKGTFANYRILTRTKSNGIPDIRRPVGRIHVQNVLNESISSFLYFIWAITRTKS